MRPAYFLALALIAACTTSRQPAATTTVAAQLAQALDERPLVAIGESHRSAQSHAFLQSLLRDPAFICHVDDIVVEFGNARFQSVADSYASGGEVAEEEFQSIWRETGQWLAWDSPLYENFFRTVREINGQRLCDHPIRVLLGDPPIDWDLVHSAADYAPFADRDGFYASVVEREVLARDRRALLVVGSMHLLKVHPPGFPPTLAQTIERQRPGSLFAVFPIAPGARDAAGIAMGPPPNLASVANWPAAERSFATLLPAGVMRRVEVEGELVWRPITELSWPPIAEVIDAILYLGDDDTVVDPPPAIYLDPQYQARLRARARVLQEVYGIDFLPELDHLVQSAERGR